MTPIEIALVVIMGLFIAVWGIISALNPWDSLGIQGPPLSPWELELDDVVGKIKSTAERLLQELASEQASPRELRNEILQLFRDSFLSLSELLHQRSRLRIEKFLAHAIGVLSRKQIRCAIGERGRDLSKDEMKALAEASLQVVRGYCEKRVDLCYEGLARLLFVIENRMPAKERPSRDWCEDLMPRLRQVSKEREIRRELESSGLWEELQELSRERQDANLFALIYALEANLTSKSFANKKLQKKQQEIQQKMFDQFIEGLEALCCNDILGQYTATYRMIYLGSTLRGRPRADEFEMRGLRAVMSRLLEPQP
jgi:hypothetical protein